MRLGRGLVFDDEIAAQQRMHIRCNFGSGREPEIAGQFPESRGPSKQRERKGPSENESRIRGQERKGVRGAKGLKLWRIKEDRGTSFFSYQIIEFASTNFCTCTFCTYTFRNYTCTTIS